MAGKKPSFSDAAGSVTVMSADTFSKLTAAELKPPTGIADVPLRLPQAMVDANLLQPHPMNAKLHDEAWLKASLEGLGQTEPITVNQTPDGLQILSGHGRVEVWKRTRPNELLQVTVLDVDEATALRILANSNPGASDPGYDQRSLLELLQAISETPGGLDVTQHDEAEIETLLRIIEATDPLPPRPRDGGDDDPDADDGEGGTNAKNEWWDMPDVPDLVDGVVPHRKIIMAFRNDADVSAFGEAIGQIITSKIKSLWFPAREHTVQKNYRVVGGETDEF